MLAFSYCDLQIHINLFFSHIITDTWSITIQMKSRSSEYFIILSVI
jgi:hypothetical protein